MIDYDENEDENLPHRYAKKPCSMVKPCANCPFLKKGFIPLMPGRVRGIIDNLMQSDFNGFPCHKTTTSSGATGTRVYECAGAMIYRLTAKRPSVLMRVCWRGQGGYMELMKNAYLVITHPYKGNR
jgi:hypothetical protein